MAVILANRERMSALLAVPVAVVPVVVAVVVREVALESSTRCLGVSFRFRDPRSRLVRR